MNNIYNSFCNSISYVYSNSLENPSEEKPKSCQINDPAVL